jgi:hypothetical protein
VGIDDGLSSSAMMTRPPKRTAVPARLSPTVGLLCKPRLGEFAGGQCWAAHLATGCYSQIRYDGLPATLATPQVGDVAFGTKCRNLRSDHQLQAGLASGQFANTRPMLLERYVPAMLVHRMLPCPYCSNSLPERIFSTSVTRDGTRSFNELSTEI